MRRSLCRGAVLIVLIVYCSAVSQLAGARLLGESSQGRVEIREFGKVKEGLVVEATLRRGLLEVHLINWGARITQLHIPDAHGKTADVVLGFDTLKGYQNESADPYFGAIVGRVANRIAGGTFVLDHKRYNLSKNVGNNTLHGGTIGYDKVLWNLTVLVDKNDGMEYVQFTYHSLDGEQGFPGDVYVKVTYKLTKDMELIIDMKGFVGNKSTPVSLAQHTYWNLGGHESGTILNNTIEIAADLVTQVDAELIPTGKFEQVKGTPYDFTKPRLIGSQINELSGGYDINYVLKGDKVVQVEGKALHLAAKVIEPKSQRAMEVYTNKPGLQFYTDNQLMESKGKGGATYGIHDALCLETQGFPNAVNEPNFPSIIVRPGHPYHHMMLIRFSIEKCIAH